MISRRRPDSNGIAINSGPLDDEEISYLTTLDKSWIKQIKKKQASRRSARPVSSGGGRSRRTRRTKSNLGQENDMGMLANWIFQVTTPLRGLRWSFYRMKDELLMKLGGRRRMKDGLVGDVQNLARSAGFGRKPNVTPKLPPKAPPKPPPRKR